LSLVNRTLTTTQKLVASAAVLATAGALTAGAFAAWTSTASQHQDLGTATVSSTFTGQNGDAWTDVDLLGMLAGDSISRFAALTNTGSLAQAFTVKVEGAEGTMTADHDGLQVSISTCLTPWVDLTCSRGGSLLAPTYITDAGVVSDPITLEPNGGVTYLKVDFLLPDLSSASFQGKADRFMVTETGAPTRNVNDYLVPDPSASPSS
jgi:hypothetical protein